MKKRLLKILLTGMTAMMITAISGCGVTQTPEPAGKETELTTTEAAADTENEAEKTAAATEAAETEMAPDFETVLSTGETVRLSDYRGKKVLLNFWATWCGYCIMEFPALERLSNDYPDDLAVLAIDCGEKESVVQDFLEKNEYTFAVGLDETYTVQSLYPTNGIPYTVLIDEEGGVIHRTTGLPAKEENDIYEYYRSALELPGQS